MLRGGEEDGGRRALRQPPEAPLRLSAILGILGSRAVQGLSILGDLGCFGPGPWTLSKRDALTLRAAIRARYPSYPTYIEASHRITLLSSRPSADRSRRPPLPARLTPSPRPPQHRYSHRPSPHITPPPGNH